MATNLITFRFHFLSQIVLCSHTNTSLNFKHIITMQEYAFLIFIMPALAFCNGLVVCFSSCHDYDNTVAIKNDMKRYQCYPKLRRYILLYLRRSYCKIQPYLQSCSALLFPGKAALSWVLHFFQWCVAEKCTSTLQLCWQAYACASQVWGQQSTFHG